MLKRTGVLALGLAAGAAANAGIIFAGGGGSIPNNTGVALQSDITVNTSAAITDVIFSVQLNHNWMGDVRARVTHVNSGSSAWLFYKVGATGGTGNGDASDFNGTYRFHPTFAGNLWSAAAIAGSSATVAQGDYAPTTINNAAVSYGTFVGLNAASDWKLEVWDNGTGGTGAVQGWSVEIFVVPPAGSVALAGVAGLISVRRRR